MATRSWDTIPPTLVDDDTARRLTITRVLLERALDDLNAVEFTVDGELRERISDVTMNVALALDELGHST